MNIERYKTISLIVIIVSVVMTQIWAQQATPSPTAPFSQFVKDQTFFTIYLPDVAHFSKNLSSTPLGDFWRDKNARPWRDAVTDEWKTITSKTFDPFPLLKQTNSLLVSVSFPYNQMPKFRNLQPAIICKLQKDKISSAKEYVKNILAKWTTQKPEAFKYSTTQFFRS